MPNWICSDINVFISFAPMICLWIHAGDKENSGMQWDHVTATGQLKNVKSGLCLVSLDNYRNLEWSNHHSVLMIRKVSHTYSWRPFLAYTHSTSHGNLVARIVTTQIWWSLLILMGVVGCTYRIHWRTLKNILKMQRTSVHHFVWTSASPIIDTSVLHFARSDYMDETKLAIVNLHKSWWMSGRGHCTDRN